MGEMHENPAHVRILEEWMKSYRPAELFDSSGRLRPELADLAPRGTRRMSANPHTNGGLLLRELRLPNFRDYAVEVNAPGAVSAESTRVMGRFLSVLACGACARAQPLRAAFGRAICARPFCP